MRIGIITGEYPPMQGGVGAYTQILARCFSALGHDVFVLTSVHADLLNDVVDIDNTISSWGIGSLRKIRQWVAVNHLDLVNIQFETAAYGMSPFVHFIPNFVQVIPVVTTFHDLLVPYLFPKAGRLRKWIVQHLANASDGVIATNHEDYVELKKHHRSALIPIGSNVSTKLPEDYDRAAWRQSVGTDEDTLLLAYFGFLNRTKGMETLLHALKQLLDENISTDLIMLGGRTGSSDPANQQYAAEIEQLIEVLGVSSHTHQTGFVDDQSVAAYLNTADAVVLPFNDGASYRRGSLMAAIQHGSPIITTQPAVDMPTFTHNENMLLFPPGDVEALVSELKRIKTDPTLRTRLMQGVQGIAHYFSWDKITGEMIDFFQAVIHADD